MAPSKMTTLFGILLGSAAATDLLPRNVRISGTQFVNTLSGAPVVLSGPNVVVKGPPYMPSVSGSTICNDVASVD